MAVGETLTPSCVAPNSPDNQVCFQVTVLAWSALQARRELTDTARWINVTLCSERDPFPALPDSLAHSQIRLRVTVL
jgi:hypothetical protein